MGGPKLPGVSSPLIDLDGALEVDVGVAWGVATGAGVPVDGVDLPESNVGGGVGVVIEGIGISSAFVRNDALAACLVPAVLAAPCSDVLHGLGGAAVASWAVA